MRHFTMAIAVGLAAMIACGPTSTSDDDPGETDGGDGDPGVEVALAGTTLDYFSGAAVGGVALKTGGLATELTATSDETGTFVLPNVPPEGVFFVLADGGDLFAPTFSDLISMGAVSISADVFLVSRADVARQYSTAGIEAAVGSSIVIAQLSTPTGEPLIGVPRDAISLLTETGESVGNALFVDPVGDVDPNTDNSAEGPRGAEVIFLDVAPGSYQLVVDCSTCVPAATWATTIFAGPDGVTLATARLETVPDSAASPRFDPDVYSVLQRGSDGGAGCALCHTALGPAGYLPFDGSPADVHDSLTRGGRLVDENDPRDSELLRKPLFELPPDHPNATWLNDKNPDYELVLRWIQGGALY